VSPYILAISLLSSVRCIVKEVMALQFAAEARQTTVWRQFLSMLSMGADSVPFIEQIADGSLQQAAFHMGDEPSLGDEVSTVV
jgi:hypothetical protein